MSEMLKKLTVVANGKFSKLDICSDAAEYASGRFGAVIFVQHLYDEAINKVFKICRWWIVCKVELEDKVQVSQSDLQTIYKWSMLWNR